MHHQVCTNCLTCQALKLTRNTCKQPTLMDGSRLCRQPHLYICSKEWFQSHFLIKLKRLNQRISDWMSWEPPWFWLIFCSFAERGICKRWTWNWGLNDIFLVRCWPGQCCYSLKLTWSDQSLQMNQLHYNLSESCDCSNSANIDSFI